MYVCMYGTLIGNPMLEVEPTGQRGRACTGSGCNGGGVSFRRHRKPMKHRNEMNELVNAYVSDVISFS